MRTVKYSGLTIRVENPAGSTRKGVDKDGKPWQVTMTNDYGEIVGSMGVDGDPVDVFLGPNRGAKFVYVVHQLKKDGSAWDEDKCMLGFTDTMTAKRAYEKNYDLPDHFFGSIEAIPIGVFRQKVLNSKKEPSMIHASKLNTTIALYADGTSGGPGIGTPVTVDGMHGRGVIVRISGRRITVRFRSGEYLTRDVGSVHSFDDNKYKSRYSSVSARGTSEGAYLGWETRGHKPSRTSEKMNQRLTYQHVNDRDKNTKDKWRRLNVWRQRVVNTRIRELTKSGTEKVEAFKQATKELVQGKLDKY